MLRPLSTPSWFHLLTSLDRMKKTRKFGGFSKAFLIFNAVLCIAVSGFFLYCMIAAKTYNLANVRQWMAYFLLLALIPIHAMITITCFNPTDCIKLFVRPYYSSMVIWATVYLAITPVYAPEVWTILFNVLVGGASSLYYWGLLEYWFKMDGNEKGDDVEILSADVVEEDPLERA